ncbi:MAG: hypothetical protein EOP09_15020, partial [Proteobacteria bacterium]
MGCISQRETVSGPMMMTGVNGQTYYGCVQAEDKAGNVSAFAATSSTVTVVLTPAVGGASSGEVLGSWDNGTAKVKLTLQSPPSNVTHFRIYFSETSNINDFDFTQPYAEIEVGDSDFDADPNDNELLLSVPAKDLRDGHYIARFYDTLGSYQDTNTTMTSRVNVLTDQPGYVLIPRKFSGLAYDYYMMRYEASSAGSGALSLGSYVTATESDIVACSEAFHKDGNASSSSCGNSATTESASSVSGVLPYQNLTYHEAFFTCRNASTANSKIRLPSREEWTRAAAGVDATYSVHWGMLSDGTTCETFGGAPTNTDANPLCKTALGLVNMAGNVSEWVDTRFKEYDITLNAETRFGYGPKILTSIPNALDNRRTRLFNTATSGGDRAAAMGASTRA